MATIWDADAGSSQGRIEPTDGPAFEGAFGYQFGHDQPGTIRALWVDDSHQISQTADLTGVTVLRLKIRLRPPETMPNDTEFLFYLYVDGTPITNIHINAVPGSPLFTFIDVAANVAYFGPGMHTIDMVLGFTVGGIDGPYEVEMPGLLVDDIIEDTASLDPGLANRKPEPGWVDVPAVTAVFFDIFATGASPPDLTRTTIYVNGVIIFQAGAFLAGWTSSFTGSFFAGAVGFIVVPDSFAFYTSEMVVTFRVTSAVVGGPSNALDTSWSFTIADTTPPKVKNAFAVDATHVRVTFNEGVVQTLAANGNDALNPANYVLDLIAGSPAVTPVVLEVEAGVSAEEVFLVLEDPLTNGATYRVTVSNVDDLHGNTIVAPDNTADFTATTCVPPAGRDSNLLRRLPQLNRDLDLARTQDLRRFLACLQIIYDELLCDIDHWTEILDVDTAPEAFVDVMLADLGNPFPFALSLVDKRRLVLLLVPLYQEKGTDQGMVDAIRIFLGVEVTIRALNNDAIWVLGESELGEDTLLGSSNLADIYSFDVISPINLTEEQRKEIRLIVAFMRRAPTHLRLIVEPDTLPVLPDHWELGLSELGTETDLH